MMSSLLVTLSKPLSGKAGYSQPQRFWRTLDAGSGDANLSSGDISTFVQSHFASVLRVPNVFSKHCLVNSVYIEKVSQ